MNRFGWVGILLVFFVLASSIAAAHSGTYEHNAKHRLDREQKYGDDDLYPRYYGNGYSHNYEYEYYFDEDHYDDGRYGNDYYWNNYDNWKEIYDVDDFDDYESFYWFKKNRQYEYDRFEDWFEDEHPWFDIDDDDWGDYLERWWDNNWGDYIYSRSRGHADWRDSDYYRYGCSSYDYGCRERVRVYVDRYDRWDDDYRYGNRYYDDYNRGRCGYKYDYYDSYCRDSYRNDWCNDGYYARKYNDQVWYVKACGRVLG
jgi:hypothetical protein